MFTPNTGSLQQDANILNIPIFEANVNEKIAIKHQLITISNPDLKYLPTLEANVTSLTLKERADAQVGKTVEFKQTMFGGRIVPSEIVDGSFIVQISNELLFIEKQTPVNVTQNAVAQYVLPRTALGVDQGAQIRFNVAVQALTNDTWDTLGSGTKPNRTISTNVRCQGTLSGLLKEVDISISEEFSR